MRRFELRDGSSSKFWEIEIQRTAVVVRFGRIGTNGQARSKKLASTKAAIAELQRLIVEKKGKGYREVRGKKVAARPPMAREKPVERATPARKTPATTRKRTPAKRGDGGILGSVPATEIPAIWARIEQAVRAKQVDLGLRPPATPAEIAAAERALGVTFPDDFRASLLVHDGQEDSLEIRWLPIALRLGSLESLTKCWTDDREYYDDSDLATRIEWLDPTHRVHQVHLHPKQIPIAGSPFWDYDRLLLDFVPGPEGWPGQVIGRADIDFVFVAQSFGALLAHIAKRLDDGSLVPEC